MRVQKNGQSFDKFGNNVRRKSEESHIPHLNRAAEAVGYNRRDYELIEAPDMQNVREKAKHILALIQGTGKQHPFVVDL